MPTRRRYKRDRSIMVTLPCWNWLPTKRGFPVLSVLQLTTKTCRAV